MRKARAIALILVLVPVSVSAQLVEIERNGGSSIGVYDYFYGAYARLGDKVQLAKTPSLENALLETNKKLELFGRDGADLNTSGIGQGTIQVTRLHIGHPTKFNVPVYLLLSPAAEVTNDHSKTNELAAASLVNPMGGIVNLSANDSHVLFGADHQYGSVRVQYHGSAKVLTGNLLKDLNSTSTSVIGYGDIGFLFQTGAWGESNKDNVGVAWLLTTIGGTVGQKDMLQNMFGDEAKNAFPHVGIAAGLEVNNYIMLKLAWTRAFDSNSSSFEDPFVRFAFDVTPQRKARQDRLRERLKALLPDGEAE